MNEQNVAYTYNGILFSLIQKEILTCVTQWMNTDDIMLNKKDKCHLYELHSQIQRQKRKMVGARGWRKGWGSCCLVDIEFHMCKMKKRSWTSPLALVVKNPPANAGDTRDAGSITGSGRSSGEGNGTPLQYSCLESSKDRGAWWATIHGVTESDMTEHTHLTLHWKMVKMINFVFFLKHK